MNRYLRIITTPASEPLLSRSLNAVSLSAELHIYDNAEGVPGHELIVMSLRERARACIWIDRLIAVRQIWWLVKEVERLGVFAPSVISPEGQHITYDRLLGVSNAARDVFRSWSAHGASHDFLASAGVERPDPREWVVPYADAPVPTNVTFLSRSAA